MSGDLLQALSEVDAAVATDATFAAAQTLRREIVARMSAVPQSVAEVPRVREPIAPAPSPPQRRTPSPWPARARAVASAGALLLVGLVAVMLVRSGGQRADVRTAELSPATRVSAAVDIPLRRVVTPTTALTAPVPVATPTPKATAVPKAEPASTEVGSTEWASSRLTRLNVQRRWRASAVHVDDAALLRDLGEGISELWVGKLTGNEDAIFVGGSLDENDWARLRASLKPTGVIWRISSRRLGPQADTSVVNAVAAGFTRGRQVRYSSDYVAEQFTPRARPLLGPARGRRSTQE